MGMTMSEKILAHGAGLDSVAAGEIVWVKVDGAMLDDILGPRIEIAEKLELLGARIWDPDKVTVISDHYTPPANAKQAEIVKFTREWSAENKIKHYYEFAGPCHQLMVEHGRVAPGQIIVGTDSHTCTYGALGAFSTGIGSTEMLGVLATGEIWLKVPQSIKVCCEGQLPRLVMAKDVILAVIGQLGHQGATYQALEFCGSTLKLACKSYPNQWIEPKWTTQWFPDAFVGTMANLLCAVEKGTDPEISARDNVKTLACVEACYQSIAQEKTIYLDQILNA